MVMVSPVWKSSSQMNGLRVEHDRVSGLMGQRLLQGWTMLGDTCPLCSAYPLMSLCGGPRQCVLCGPEPGAQTEGAVKESPPASGHNGRYYACPRVGFMQGDHVEKCTSV
jgi:uncharacterized Zn finger protein (UPF0148 family)